MESDHGQQVESISADVRRLYEAHLPFRVYHGSTNATRIVAFKRSEMVDVSGLNHVLSVNARKRTAWVEANVPMDKLVAATLRRGLIPKVVPEFPGITVGGGIQGGAGESSSFRYGCFSQTCNRYEMILGNGEVVDVSGKHHADLFYGTAGSFGTLGIITAAEIQLIPAKRYVVLDYAPVSSFQTAVDTIAARANKGYDYIDGVMFSATNGVIITGRLSDKRRGTVQRFSRSYDPWYYLHVQKISRRAGPYVESVPLTDYLFRYDRGGFWVGKYAFDMSGVPFNSFTRWLLNPLLRTRKLYQALQESAASQQFIVQDLALPQDTSVAFMQYIDQSLHIYPLWLCPLKPDNRSPLQSNAIRGPIGINVGVWGNRILDHKKFVVSNRGIERKLMEFGGKKWFYAHSYYTRAEFWRLYDKAWYDNIRSTYRAERLPDIYDKICVKQVYEVHNKYGAWRTMRGTAKLRITD